MNKGVDGRKEGVKGRIEGVHGRNGVGLREVMRGWKEGGGDIVDGSN